MYPKETKNKFIALVLCLTIILSTTGVYAQDSRITNLQEDQPAPYAGVLMDTNTAAEVLAREEYNKIECKLKIKNEIEKIKAKNLLEMGTLQASFDSLKEQNFSILKIKDAEILRLQELAFKNPNDNAHWWMAGGVVAGILTSIAIFYAAVEVRDSGQ